MKSNRDDILKNMEDALKVATDSIRAAQASMSVIKDIDPSIAQDINFVIKSFQSGNDNMEDALKKILKKNEDKLKDNAVDNK